MEHPNKDLINTERTWRTVVCISPTHELVRFDTNQVGTIRCPLCNSLMVTEIKPMFVVDDEQT